LHHAIFRILYPIFDKSFIFDSYSCRLNKGTHRAINRLNYFAKKVSKNNLKNCYILKCDVKKYFESINQDTLLNLIRKKVDDEEVLRLINKIVKSFEKGIPLGNITSQLFANIYLNELDQFVKHNLKIKYYIRYCDDFLILSEGKIYLENLITKIDKFLKENLKLHLHPNKVTIREYHQGIDFLGYVSFSYHRVLRTKTKKRMFVKINSKNKQSYFGILKHCNSYKIKKLLLD
jgi:RNA-directed DNA polymerase